MIFNNQQQSSDENLNARFT